MSKILKTNTLSDYSVEQTNVRSNENVIPPNNENVQTPPQPDVCGYMKKIQQELEKMSETLKETAESIGDLDVDKSLHLIMMGCGFLLCGLLLFIIAPQHFFKMLLICVILMVIIYKYTFITNMLRQMTNQIIDPSFTNMRTKTNMKCPLHTPGHTFANNTTSGTYNGKENIIYEGVDVHDNENMVESDTDNKSYNRDTKGIFKTKPIKNIHLLRSLIANINDK